MELLKKINIINTKKRNKEISPKILAFSIPQYPHNSLIEVLSEMIYFVFQSKVCSKIGFSVTSIHWTSNGLGKKYFTEKSLIEGIALLIENCYFTFGNKVLKHNIEISMGTDHAPLWISLFLYFFKSKHVQNLISKKSTRTYKYHATSQFIDVLFVLNDDDEFSKSLKCIYP